MLGIPQMLIKFGLQAPLQASLDQLVQEPIKLATRNQALKNLTPRRRTRLKILMCHSHSVSYSRTHLHKQSDTLAWASQLVTITA